MCLNNENLFNIYNLSGRYGRIIPRASFEASSSQLNYRHGALLVHGNRIMASAPNEARSKWGNYMNCCLHAEVNVIKHYCSSVLKKSFDKHWVLQRKEAHAKT